MLSPLRGGNHHKLCEKTASYMELVWPSLLALLQSLLMDIQGTFKQSLSDEIFVECTHCYISRESIRKYPTKMESAVMIYTCLMFLPSDELVKGLNIVLNPKGAEFNMKLSEGDIVILKNGAYDHFNLNGTSHVFIEFKFKARHS